MGQIIVATSILLYSRVACQQFDLTFPHTCLAEGTLPCPLEPVCPLTGFSVQNLLFFTNSSSTVLPVLCYHFGLTLCYLSCCHLWSKFSLNCLAIGAIPGHLWPTFCECWLRLTLPLPVTWCRYSTVPLLTTLPPYLWPAIGAMLYHCYTNAVPAVGAILYHFWQKICPYLWPAVGAILCHFWHKFCPYLWPTIGAIPYHSWHKFCPHPWLQYWAHLWPNFSPYLPEQAQCHVCFDRPFPVPVFASIPWLMSTVGAETEGPELSQTVLYSHTCLHVHTMVNEHCGCRNWGPRAVPDCLVFRLAWSRSEYSFACFTHCQSSSPLVFVCNLPLFFPILFH